MRADGKHSWPGEILVDVVVQTILNLLEALFTL